MADYYEEPELSPEQLRRDSSLRISELHQRNSLLLDLLSKDYPRVVAKVGPGIPEINAVISYYRQAVEISKMVREFSKIDSAPDSPETIQTGVAKLLKSVGVGEDSFLVDELTQHLSNIGEFPRQLAQAILSVSED